MLNYFDHIYIINKDPILNSRWWNCKNEFKKINFDFSKVERISIEFDKNISNNENLTNVWLYIINDAKSKGYNKILIHEDDFEYINYDLGLETINQLDNTDWDMFYLGGLFRVKHRPRNENEELLNVKEYLNKYNDYEKYSDNLVKVNNGNIGLTHSVALSSNIYDKFLGLKSEIENSDLKNKDFAIDMIIINFLQSEGLTYNIFAACPVITKAKPNISYRSLNYVDFKETECELYNELLNIEK